ncbi:hypothetical protein [Silvimonas sp.]|uniref:hypothetical protein n=1 Tax=Silvimonas sp. TaxID=2650811 RepID=UPI002840F282|nr:hypothetical protein [Silvimonas sp.]MDR3427829.1 hypothetical protein [Silvimonas sp.]
MLRVHISDFHHIALAVARTGAPHGDLTRSRHGAELCGYIFVLLPPHHVTRVHGSGAIALFNRFHAHAGRRGGHLQFGAGNFARRREHEITWLPSLKIRAVALRGAVEDGRAQVGICLVNLIEQLITITQGGKFLVAILIFLASRLDIYIPAAQRGFAGFAGQACGKKLLGQGQQRHLLQILPMRVVARAPIGRQLRVNAVERLHDTIGQFMLTGKVKVAGAERTGAHATKLLGPMLKFTGVPADALVVARRDGENGLEIVKVGLDFLGVRLVLVIYLHTAKTQPLHNGIHVAFVHGRPLKFLLQQPAVVQVKPGHFVRMPDTLLKLHVGRHTASREARLVERAQNILRPITLARPGDQIRALPDLMFRPNEIEPLPAQNITIRQRHIERLIRAHIIRAQRPGGRPLKPIPIRQPASVIPPAGWTVILKMFRPAQTGFHFRGHIAPQKPEERYRLVSLTQTGAQRFRAFRFPGKLPNSCSRLGCPAIIGRVGAAGPHRGHIQGQQLRPYMRLYSQKLPLTFLTAAQGRRQAFRR